MFKELTDSLQKAGSERLRNPIVGAFVISWSVINWRSIATLLLAETAIDKRIETIDKYANWITYLALPFLASVIYVILMPWVALFFETLMVVPISKRKEAKINNETNLMGARILLAEQEARHANAFERIDELEKLERRKIESEIELNERQLALESSTEKALQGFRERTTQYEKELSREFVQLQNTLEESNKELNNRQRNLELSTETALHEFREGTKKSEDVKSRNFTALSNKIQESNVKLNERQRALVSSTEKALQEFQERSTQFEEVKSNLAQVESTVMQSKGAIDQLRREYDAFLLNNQNR